VDHRENHRPVEMNATSERSAVTHEDPSPGADDELASDPNRVDEQEQESFPASDPHSGWSGPPDPQPERNDEVGE
jgi:hypothetical protein